MDRQTDAKAGEVGFGLEAQIAPVLRRYIGRDRQTESGSLSHLPRGEERHHDLIPVFLRNTLTGVFHPDDQVRPFPLQMDSDPAPSVSMDGRMGIIQKVHDQMHEADRFHLNAQIFELVMHLKPDTF